MGMRLTSSVGNAQRHLLADIAVGRMATINDVWYGFIADSQISLRPTAIMQI
jgi:hypothetical protein